MYINYLYNNYIITICVAITINKVCFNLLLTISMCFKFVIAAHAQNDSSSGR